MLNRLLCHAALCACAWVLAGPAAHAAESPPPEPGQAPPAPFERYQGWREASPGDWRETNDRVGAVGGWRTYLRESHPEAESDAGHAPAAHHH